MRTFVHPEITYLPRSFVKFYCAFYVYFQQTRESWQVVFFISAGILAFGGVFYCVLGSGVIQPWAHEHLPPTNDIFLIPKPDRASAPPVDTK